MKLCSELYSGAKSRFKKKHFTILGGLGNRDAILRKIPEGLTPEMWNEMVNSYCDEVNVHRSEVNKSNRSRRSYPSYHGTKSIVSTRHERRQIDGRYPSLIENFKERYSKNGKIPLPELAQQQYDEMNDLLSRQEGAADPLSEKQIMDQVLGTRRGFNRGRGHIVPGLARFCSSSSSTGQSTPPPPVYTQEQVNEKLASSNRRYKRLATKMKDVVEGLAEHEIVIQFDSEYESDSSD
ncbi:hypothetical protein QVD17_14132 [Tagetes erecta]|nr:hypothetical protein QVD17_14132 [Tagetes erecta]